MSVARKLAIPAAGLAAAAMAQGAGTAAAATAPHHSDATTVTASAAKATVTKAASRRAHAVDILDQRPMSVHPDTASTSKSVASEYIHFYIAGARSHVSYASTYACIGFESLPKAHLEIRKPNGTAWANGGQVDMHPQTCISLGGYPDINDAGVWTAILWEKSLYYPGGYTNMISTGIHVLT
jgi:hypothetical protein